MRPTETDKKLGTLLFGCVGPLTAGFTLAWVAYALGFEHLVCWGSVLALTALGTSFYVLFGGLLETGG